MQMELTTRKHSDRQFLAHIVDKGHWIVGFVQKLWGSTVDEAGLLAMKIGLEMAWELRPQRIMVECDSISVMSMLTCGNVVMDNLRGILWMIAELFLDGHWRFKFEKSTDWLMVLRMQWLNYVII